MHFGHIDEHIDKSKLPYGNQIQFNNGAKNHQQHKILSINQYHAVKILIAGFNSHRVSLPESSFPKIRVPSLGQ